MFTAAACFKNYSTIQKINDLNVNVYDQIAFGITYSRFLAILEIDNSGEINYPKPPNCRLTNFTHYRICVGETNILGLRM